MTSVIEYDKRTCCICKKEKVYDANKNTPSVHAGWVHVQLWTKSFDQHYDVCSMRCLEEFSKLDGKKRYRLQKKFDDSHRELYSEDLY